MAPRLINKRSFLAITLLLIVYLLYYSKHATWRLADDAWLLEAEKTPFETIPVSEENMKKPLANDNYTRAVVVSRRARDGLLWLTERLKSDILFELYVFTVDDPESSAWRVPANKGNEAMPYLTYIIENYDSLPDITIFMHHHRKTWHNNDLLASDAVMQIQRLSPAKIIRDGFMNLRCHWEPGCDIALRPGTSDPNPLRDEEPYLASVWPELFPGNAIPEELWQPCCGQFAVSRDRIRSIPRARFEAMRRWLVDTHLQSGTAGRIFENTWHYIFTGEPARCPSEHVCYCDGYGVCFNGEQDYTAWFELKREYHSMEPMLKNDNEDENSAKLRTKMRDILRQLMSRWAAAIIRGNDPKARAKEAGRKWSPTGGF